MRAIQSVELSEHLSLVECHPYAECRHINWRLYDTRVGYNIAVHAKTRDEALVCAINYWAERFLELHAQHYKLQAAIDTFVGAVRPADEFDSESPY